MASSGLFQPPLGWGQLVHTNRLLGFHSNEGREHTADASQKKGEAQVGATSRNESKAGHQVK